MEHRKAGKSPWTFFKVNQRSEFLSKPVSENIHARSAISCHIDAGVSLSQIEKSLRTLEGMRRHVLSLLHFWKMCFHVIKAHLHGYV